MGSSTLYTHIEADPSVCSGLPRLAGTRVRVIDVVALHEAGRSPEEILLDYDHLTLGQVYAALAYYYDHKAEVLVQLESDRNAVEHFKRKHPDLTR